MTQRETVRLRGYPIEGNRDIDRKREIEKQNDKRQGDRVRQIYKGDRAIEGERDRETKIEGAKEL